MTPSLGTPSSLQSNNPAASLQSSTVEQNQRSQTKIVCTGLPKATTALLWPAAALLCWTICSSGLILLNKELMVTDGFKFPMALTAAGQFISYLGGKATAVCMQYASVMLYTLWLMFVMACVKLQLI